VAFSPRDKNQARESIHPVLDRSEIEASQRLLENPISPVRHRGGTGRSVWRDVSAAEVPVTWEGDAPPDVRIAEVMEIRAQDAEVRRQLRQRMLRTLFERVPVACFDRCLEVGAGDGFQSAFLANYTRFMVSTDIRLGKLVCPRRENTRYLYSDAERVPFRAASFDLIFSSHLLEHLPNLPLALLELRRVLRDDGVVIHVVPSRFWKLLDVGLFYPSQVVHLIEKYTGHQRYRKTVAQGLRGSSGSNVKGPAQGWWRRSLWPPVHGIARSNLAEFQRFDPRRWIEEFKQAGMAVVGVVDRLPVHSPYRFGWERARRLLEGLGATSSVGYVVGKAHMHPERASLFLPPKNDALG
jgi:SAM-dependent methyltransferase